MVYFILMVKGGVVVLIRQDKSFTIEELVHLARSLNKIRKEAENLNDEYFVTNLFYQVENWFAEQIHEIEEEVGSKVVWKEDD